jgi:hypothetical protein
MMKQELINSNKQLEGSSVMVWCIFIFMTKIADINTGGLAPTKRGNE